MNDFEWLFFKRVNGLVMTQHIEVFQGGGSGQVITIITPTSHKYFIYGNMFVSLSGYVAPMRDPYIFQVYNSVTGVFFIKYFIGFGNAGGIADHLPNINGEYILVNGANNFQIQLQNSYARPYMASISVDYTFILSD